MIKIGYKAMFYAATKGMSSVTVWICLYKNPIVPKLLTFPQKSKKYISIYPKK